MDKTFCEKTESNCGYGISVQEGSTTSYIYVCGIKPIREICLDENVTLIPVISSPNPDDMIDCIMKYGNGCEFEMGLLIATLRMVTAQLKITAVNSKELAIKTWNAQHICIQISAMLNCEVAWYFQASNSADKFNAHTQVSMIYPNMYKFPSGVQVVEEEQCAYLEQNMATALRLENNEEYGNASNALWCYKMHFRPSVQLSVLWGGIESLFLFEKNIKKNLSVSVSRFINNNDDEVEEIRDLYESRCKAVHELKNGQDTALADSANLLHKLICKCIENGAVPDVDELLKGIL